MYLLTGFYGLFLACLSQGFAQSNAREIDAANLISASQAGAMPLYFDVNDPGIPLIKRSNRQYAGEFYIRNGLQNFFTRAKRGDSLKVGFIGGSITRADHQYRTQTAKFLQSLFPRAKMTGLNAGISGTGSDLGACRVYEQLLVHKPDLIFIEFAVNGAFAPGIEGIIRQIRKFDRSTEICLIYTIGSGQAEMYSNGGVPNAVK